MLKRILFVVLLVVPILMSFAVTGSKDLESTLSKAEIELIKKDLFKDHMLELSNKNFKKSFEKNFKITESFFSLSDSVRNRNNCHVVCDDDDDDDDVGETSCWDNCSANGNSTNYCNSICGSDSGGGEKSCWDNCTDNGNSTNYCNSVCGSDSDSGTESCWDNCTSNGNSTNYCNSICGTDSDTGVKSCWDSCTANGNSTNYCNSICNN